MDPSTNVMLRANGEQAWFGWPKDEQLEALSTQWLKAEDLEDRQAIAAKIQQRAFEAAILRSEIHGHKSHSCFDPQC